MKFKRRTFLRGAGGIALATPFLSSLTPKVSADAGAGVKRLITFCSSQGGDNRQMFANTSGLTATAIAGAQHTNAFSLNDVSGPLSDYYDSRWDMYRDEMLFLRHLDPLTVQNHSHSLYLAGWSDHGGWEHNRVNQPHETIDRIIARHISGGTTPVLNLGAGPTDSYGDASISYERRSVRGGVHPWIENCGKAPVDTDPRVLFDRLFRNVGQSDDERRVANERERLLVDSVLDDYRSVRGGRRISRLDRERLDEHMEHISALESSLRSTDFGPMCTPPLRPDEFDIGARRNDPVVLEALADVAIAALRCDISRVVTMYSRLEYLSSFTEMTQSSHPAHHGAKHDPRNAEETIALDDLGIHARFVLDYVLQLTEGLANSLDENGESMLKSSIIYSTRELAHVGDHWLNSHPVLLIGGSGCLNSGQQISYATDQARPADVDPYSQFVGRSYAGLLTTLMTAMGLQPEHWAAETGGRVGDHWFRQTGVEEDDNILQGTEANALLPGVLRT